MNAAITPEQATERGLRIDTAFQKLIPPLSPEELAQLEANLVAHGCRDPLVTWGETLIDGHNRFEICTRLDIPFETVAMVFADDEAAMDWMDANQLGRRNLKPDQLSYLRGRRYSRTNKGHGGDRKSEKSSVQFADLISTAETLAKEHGVNESTIRRDGKKFEAMEKLAVTHPDLAQEVFDGKKKINEVRRTVRSVEVKAAALLPSAKFRVIYADPPWKYGDQLTEDYGPTKFHYPSMSISELCAMPIKELCEPDAVLFLWVTSPLLFECLPIIDAWGFAYKTSFVWDKIKHNMGHYNSVRHELLLICTRGSCTPDNVQLFDSVQSIERGKHSEKPAEFRAIIETLYEHGKKLELFARQPAENWTVYGNQVSAVGGSGR
jgi:N6-adenosine-specific RNA methylase IME4